MKVIDYIETMRTSSNKAVLELADKLHDKLRAFDLNLTGSVNPKNRLSDLMEAQSLIQSNMDLLMKDKLMTSNTARKFRGSFLEEYALNLLKFLVWNDLGFELLVITLDVEVPLWKGYVWENQKPSEEAVFWKPDVAVGRYFKDKDYRELNDITREVIEEKKSIGFFVPLVVISCKSRVSLAEFFDDRGRFEVLRHSFPSTLALELANERKMAESHFEADAWAANTYFLEEGQDSVNRFVQHIRNHIEKYMG